VEWEWFTRPATAIFRLVAIKVLPAERVADPDSKRRFVQEAKAASALNHPNIVTIYDIDQADGVYFIAMEFVAGKPLDRLIPRQGLGLNSMLKYAVQVADALAAAHAAGIVHRDLKPGNLIVTDKDLVKVLDFGLAKLTEAPPIAESEGEETILIIRQDRTEEGVILGTVSYMSPEQAEGKPIDSRSDIFSLGSVIYEMATGRKAFQAETRLSTLTAILRDEPKRASEIVESLPREVERIISRCLRKELNRRFQNMHDLKVELEELKEESESGKLLAPARTSGRTRHWNPVWLAGLVALLLVGALVAWFFRPIPKAPAVDLAAVPLTSYPGTEDFPTFSPDGSQIAFMWNGANQDNFDIYVKLAGPGPPLRLTSDPAVDSSPAWSPNGQSIAFLRELPGGRFAVLLIPPIGGPERRLAEIPFPFSINPLSVAWSPDGSSLAVTDQDAPNQPPGIFLLSTETGEKRRLTSPPPHSRGDYAPAFSPDGRTLGFVRLKASGYSGDILTLPLSSSLEPRGEPKLVMSNNHIFYGLTWTVDGSEIIAAAGIGSFSAGSLWRIAGDGSRKPERIAFTGDESASPSLSRQGNRLAYSRGAIDRNIWRLELTRETEAGRPTRFISSTRQDASAEFSPDGKKIAFYSNRSGNDEIWVCNSDGTNPVQITSLGGPSSGTPRWSPDGEQIVFDSSPDGHWDIFVVGTNGGKPRRLTNQPSAESVPSWSRDGKWVYFYSDRSGTVQIWKMPPQGGEATQVTSHGGYAASESPDGKLLYYTKSVEGKEGLWRMPVTGGEETQVINRVIARRAFSVTRDGVYFITGTDSSVTRDGVYFIADTESFTIQFFSFRTQQYRTLAKVENPFVYLSVSPDNKSILYTQYDQSGSDFNAGGKLQVVPERGSCFILCPRWHQP
jgi:eukaryotic-like serine/threonine-protein kinase